MSKIMIAIPARYGSSRFPGKPLAKIAGREMLLRVYENARMAAESFADVRIAVATEDERIKTFCESNGIECVLTSEACLTGTDRVLEAVETLKLTPDFIVNLQGDNPLCPPWFIEDLLKAYRDDDSVEVATPCVRLSWAELDVLRKNKETTPFSGTTCIAGKDGNAIWFSKNIIPAIRKEKDLREKGEMSPVYRHIGLYGYRYAVLKQFTGMPEGIYEKLEGLEQLRFLENGIRIKLVTVDYRGYGSMSGVDSQEDLVRAEEMFKKYGEFK